MFFNRKYIMDSYGAELRKYIPESYLAELREQLIHNLETVNSSSKKRGLETFFNDIQMTIDAGELSLQMSVLTLATYNFLYEYNAPDPYFPADDSNLELLTKEVKSEMETMKYSELPLREMRVIFHSHIPLLFESCRTLTCAENQLKAAERQSAINEKYYPPFLPKEVSDDFFEKLYELKEKYKFTKTLRMAKHEYILNCKKLYQKCIVQPIAAMLLPVVLTIYSTDGTLYKNLYSYFKYKDRRLSQNDQKQVLQLFDDISEVAKNQFERAQKFTIPVFLWDNIEDRFFAFQKLSEDEQQTAKKYFEKYRHANALSKPEEVKLLKLHYGKQLRSLAKLCNLNTKIISDHLSDRALPIGAKKAKEQLISEEIFAKKADTIDPNDIYAHYFLNDYESIPSFTEFSKLALLRYYGLPFQGYWKSIPNPSNTSTAKISSIMDKFCAVIWNDYCVEASSTNLLKYESLAGTNHMQKANYIQRRNHYRPRGLIQSQNYVKKSKLSALEIANKFSESDYRDFIRDTKNFNFSDFPEYLKHFCDKYELKWYDNLYGEERIIVEEEAFSTILVLIQGYLYENVDTFWKKAISDELRGIHK